MPETPIADEDYEELPRRPRRRLLAPTTLSLAGALLLACGFVGGVLVEKGQSSSSSTAGSTAGFASRLAALRGGGGTARSAGAGSAGGPGALGGATIGQVAYLSGSTLYVINAEGTTVKVATSPASTVTKTVKADVKGIHPGETVVVTGAAGANGTVGAESIRVGGSGGVGVGTLFGRSSSGGGGSSGGSGGGGEPALFGRGG